MRFDAEGHMKIQYALTVPLYVFELASNLKRELRRRR